MRILYWADRWSPFVGGVEVLGDQFLRALREQHGFEPLVVTSHGDIELPDEEVRGGIPVHRFRFHEALQTRRLDLYAAARRRLEKLKMSWQPDVVHFNFPAPGGFFHWQTRGARDGPTVLAVHTNLPGWDTGPDTLVGKLLRHAAWVTANSVAMLDIVRNAAPGIAGRSSAIHNGLAPPVESPAALPMDPPVIAFLGRLVEKKGVDLAVRAMPAIRQSVARARLLIAGDGPERETLERQVDSLGLRGCVEFRGLVAPENVASFLNEATVLTVPSRSVEPFGNVAVEAMQMGRPVVATDQGGLPEVVADGETGFIVPAGDVPALARQIVRILRDEPAARRMGEAGRARALEAFGLERYARQYVDLYRRVRATRPSVGP